MRWEGRLCRKFALRQRNLAGLPTFVCGLEWRNRLWFLTFLALPLLRGRGKQAAQLPGQAFAPDAALPGRGGRGKGGFISLRALRVGRIARKVFK